MKRRKITYEEWLDASIVRYYGWKSENITTPSKHTKTYDDFIIGFNRKRHRKNRCHICRKRFPSQEDLARHYRDKHRLLMCPNCHWTAYKNSKDILLRHLFGRMCVRCGTDLATNEEGICIALSEPKW